MSDGSHHDKSPEHDVRERDSADFQRHHQAETVDALEERVGAADLPDDSSMAPDEDVTTESHPDTDGEEHGSDVSINEPPE